MLNKKTTVLVLSLGILGGLALISCSGDTDGGSAVANNGAGSGFVATDDAAGSIEVNVNSTSLAVSDTSGFSVVVKDSTGGPVPGINISCDSESGVAIIEPSTGFELTDSNGQMSGILGCETPGSYQFGCRLSLGANKRKFVDIKCTGATPAGFGGFDGAAGGGLGGGSVVDSDDLAEDLRLTAVRAYDGGTTDGAGTTTIDVDQLCCTACTSSTDSDDSQEPFYNTLLEIDVQNDSDQTILFDSFSFTIPDSDGAGTVFNSQPLAFVEAGEVGPQGTTTLVALFLSASSGVKYFFGSSTAISSGLGFTNVTVRLGGSTTLGQSVSVTGRTVLDFGSINYCEGGCFAALSACS